MKDKRLFLRSVHVDEALVQDYMDQAVDVFKLNTVGPQKYAQLWFTIIIVIIINCYYYYYYYYSYCCCCCCCCYLWNNAWDWWGAERVQAHAVISYALHFWTRVKILAYPAPFTTEKLVHVYARITYFKSVEERETRLYATFCGVKIQYSGEVVHVTKCYNSNWVMIAQIQLVLLITSLINFFLLSKVSEHLQEISGFAKQQGRHRNQHFHSRWACFVSLVQGINIMV